MAEEGPRRILPHNEEEVHLEDEGSRHAENREEGPRGNERGENILETVQAMMHQFTQVIDDKMNAFRAEQTARDQQNKRKHGDDSGDSHPGNRERGCSYKSFIACKPPEFDGTMDPVQYKNG